MKMKPSFIDALSNRVRLPLLSLAALACLGALVLSAASSPARAALCGAIVGTAWSAPGDSNTVINDPNFLACTGGSTLAGDGAITIDPDPYSITVSAIDNDTFQLTGTISDTIPTGVGDSPLITLVLSAIPGGIVNAVYNIGAIAFPNLDFSLVGFTASTITLSGDFHCGGDGPACPFANADLGTIDVTFVPVPAALPLFASALVLIGLIARRRRNTGSAEARG
jgi:hypothetical protein